MSLIRRNGKTYTGAGVHVTFFGNIDYEVTEISYSKKQTHTANYSFGSKDPTSYSTGNNTYKASMTMRLKNVSLLEKAAGGDLLRIKPFDINVTFLDDENLLVNDTLLVKFADMGRTLVKDDNDPKQKFELFCLDIKFNNIL
jgi:hypothetical protein